MYRRFIWLLLLLAALLLLSGCRNLPGNGKAPQPSASPPESPPEPSSPLVTLSFSESASYFKRVQGYEFRTEDGKYTAYFYIANEDEPYPVPVDQAWVDTLNSFIGQYGMMRWDGFHGSDSMLLDGTQFSISFSFADGTAVHAGGYGRFPENYRDASRAIDAHFLQLLPEDMHGW
ncbi:MAG: hypothetical protein IJZ74_09675 [Clostridia bacterium]|nr:hypothetical protein [Clostridia bacterium]